MAHWYLLRSGRQFQDPTKIWLDFWQHIIDVWHVSGVYAACKGSSDLGNGPNKPTATISLVNTVPHIMMVHWYSLWSGREFQDLTKTIWPNFLTTHMIDVWHIHRSQATCRGLSDLGIGPNKPTATIIGEYSASYHHGALISTWFRARISGSDQNLA